MSDSNQLTSEDFTKSDVIDSFQKGDHTIDIVGYICNALTNAHTGSKSQFKKLICSNGAGREVQVTAWNDHKAKFDGTHIGMIVHISSLKYNVPKNINMNNGNVPFELLVKDSTQVVLYNNYEEANLILVPEEVSILDAYQRIGKRIKLDAIIKTEPGVYKNKDFMSTMASLTNLNDQLEMKLNFDWSNLKNQLLKGISVEVVGVMEQYFPGPALLRVDKPDDIKILERNRVAFIDILNGFRTK